MWQNHMYPPRTFAVLHGYPNGLSFLLFSHTSVATHVETVYNTLEKATEHVQVEAETFVAGTGFI